MLAENLMKSSVADFEVDKLIRVQPIINNILTKQIEMVRIMSFEVGYNME